MEHNSTETADLKHLCQYLQENENSTNIQLFSFLALLNAYVPKSYLRMHECQQVLGPPIHGGPPFKERMRPFTNNIDTSNPDKIRIIDQNTARQIVDQLSELKISRSITAEKLMSSLCGNPPELYVIQFIRKLLVKREMGEKDREKFSVLITEILEKEGFDPAVSVLETASDKFSRKSIFPQTVSRLYYIKTSDYDRAEEWAKIAIEIAPRSSYTADTLGQVYKHWMRAARQQDDVIEMAPEAFQAFKDVEKKADREEGPQMEGVKESFNNRGLFGFIQIAKIIFDSGNIATTLYPNLKMEVEAKFVFFERYLTYSKKNMTTTEPDYFWRDVALCYKYYTEKTASESTSFPGLLGCLSHGLFTSKERRARLFKSEKTASDLETIKDDLKTEYEENTDVRVAERYVLSNILLSNKKPDSPQLSPVAELQEILQGFLSDEVAHRRPEFCLLVLLLFWPKEQPQVTQEEEDEGNIPEGGMTFAPDLGQYVTFMENAFERAKYAKYLRGRYLLTLFFLGKGSGLSRWIHKSRLDAIVEEKVESELASERQKKNKKKVRRINDIWCNGEVWHIPQIQDILLPVQVEQEGFVCAGGKKIKARVEAKPGLRPMLYYLGFTIQGPVVFKVKAPQDGQ